LREWQEKFSDFFDESNRQGHGQLGGLFVAYFLNPEKCSVQDAEIFTRLDSFALGNFRFAFGVIVRDFKVLSGAVDGGGGSGVGHERKLADFRSVARKIFVFFLGLESGTQDMELHHETFQRSPCAQEARSFYLRVRLQPPPTRKR
jgi:hypothetical protein